MSLSIQVFGDADDLLALESMARQSPDLRGTRLERTQVPPADGEMGPLADALQWVSANNELLAALANLLSVWLVQRKTTVRVRIDGRDIIFDSGQAEDPTALALELLGAASPGEQDV